MYTKAASRLQFLKEHALAPTNDVAYVWNPLLNCFTSLTLGVKPYDIDVTAPTEPAADSCPRFRFPREPATEGCKWRLGISGDSITATAISDPSPGARDHSVATVIA